MIVIVSAALAAEGTATLTTKSGVARVEVRPPAGEHVAPDAPTRLAIGRVVIDGVGDPSSWRVTVPSGKAEVSLSLAFCKDTACRPVTLSGEGKLPGTVDLRARAVEAAPPAKGAPVKLYDFAAVWCPPCNLMAAEVLDDPEDASLFAMLPVERVDVDLPQSWVLKSRYAVGGYPTVIAVDAEGNEVDRLVGYPGEGPFKQWLAALGTEPPLWQLTGPQPTTLGDEPTRYARAARRLAEAQKPELARLYFAGAEGVDLRIARLLVEPTRADAEWLLANAEPGPWLLGALEVAPDLYAAAAPRLAMLDPATAADCLDVVARHVGADEARLLRAGAIALIRTTLTGDPAHDRAQVGTLAGLYADLGDRETALTLLAEYRKRYPGEFTFHQYATRHLLDAGRVAESVAAAEDALRTAFGDQRLRAAMSLAKALKAAGDLERARSVLTEEIRRSPRPEPGTNVRTTRYLVEAEGMLRELY